MPAPVRVDEVSPERGVSKLSRALSKLSLRSDVNDTHTVWKEQIRAFKCFHPNARKILSHVPIPPGLTRNRVRDYVHSTSITPKGKAFPPQHSEIVPNRLFVSDGFTGTDTALLLRLRITHVVCIVNAWDQDYPILPSVQYHQVVAPNDPYRARRLVATIDDAVDFIDNALRRDGSRVLVHCAMGIHWSPSMVIAWLMRNGGCAFEGAREIVRRKREVVDTGLDLEKGVKEWWALEMARPIFPPGRGGRYQSFASCLTPKLDVAYSDGSCESEEEFERDIIDIRRYS